MPGSGHLSGLTAHSPAATPSNRNPERSREVQLALASDQQRHWLDHLGEIRGERLAGRAAAMKFVRDYFVKAPHTALFAIYLDRSLRICDVVCLGAGSIEGVKISLAAIMEQGAAVDSACFILVHNQPRGDPKPSLHHIRITHRIRRVSEELDMPLLDHFIFAKDQIASVANL